MTCPTFLSKHPAYLRYVREVASGELALPEYERDENNRLILQVGEQYCRYPGCTVSDHAYRTGNLKKHVVLHDKDLQVADGIIGRINYIEQEKVRAWYNALFDSDPPSSSTSPSVAIDPQATRNTNRKTNRKANP